MRVLLLTSTVPWLVAYLQFYAYSTGRYGSPRAWELLLVVVVAVAFHSAALVVALRSWTVRRTTIVGLLLLAAYLVPSPFPALVAIVALAGKLWADSARPGAVEVLPPPR